MAYVNVVVDEPTDSPLTYRLTPETLLGAKPGVLVEVPFGNKMTTGIVLELVRTVTTELKDKVRPVSRILSPGTWAPAATMRLARAMARYCGEPLGVCLFRLLPPSGKRGNHEVRAAKRIEKGRVLHVYGGHEQRLAGYRQLVGKAVAAGQQTLLIAPLARHEWLTTKLANEGWRVQTVSAELSLTKQKAIAHDLASGLIDVLIGTRHVVGWPVYALGLQIVDDPYHQSHEDDQRPYLDSATIALTRASVDGGHVVLGSSLPSPALAAREGRGLALRLQTQNTPPSTQPLFLQSAPGQLIHPTILEAVRNALQDGHRAALIAPRHGVGGSTVCLDCGLEQTGAPECPGCHGHRFATFGIDTESIREWIKRHEPTLLSDSSEVNLGTSTSEVLESQRRSLLEITTEGIFELPQVRDVVAFLRADSPLNAPNLMRPLRYLGAVAEALATSASVFVDTADATQSWLEVLQPNTHLPTLLQERSAAHLPPFVRTLHLEGPAKDEEKARTVLEGVTLGHWEQVDEKLAIDVHLESAEFDQQRIRLKHELGRTWKLKVDTVLEHAEPVMV